MVDTPKPMQGTWTLTAPDGRTWQAETPLRCVADEQRERVPATVRLQRILDAASEGTPPVASEWLRLNAPEQFAAWAAGNAQPSTVDWMAGWDACRAAASGVKGLGDAQP